MVKWSYSDEGHDTHYLFTGVPHTVALMTFRFRLRARLHQASASMLRPLCDDASDSVLIEIYGDAWKWERYRRVAAALTLTLGVNGP